MLKQISFILLFICACLLSFEAAAQERKGPVAVENSVLTNASLPKGAVSIWEDGVPEELNKLFTESFKKYSSIARQGRTEVIVWTGKNVRADKMAGLTADIKNNLSASGWRISTEKQYKTYTEMLLVDNDEHAISGFILPADDVYIFALSELLPLDKTKD